MSSNKRVASDSKYLLARLVAIWSWFEFSFSFGAIVLPNVVMQEIMVMNILCNGSFFSLFTVWILVTFTYGNEHTTWQKLLMHNKYTQWKRQKKRRVHTQFFFFIFDKSINCLVSAIIYLHRCEFGLYGCGWWIH